MADSQLEIERTSVTLKNLTKIFNENIPGKEVVAVKDFNLKIDKGEFTTLLGPSGCGKTTTLRMIAGLEDLTKGEIYFDEKKVNSLAANKRDSALVFQNYALFPHMTVEENILYGLKIKNIDSSSAKNRLKRILSLIGMEGFENRSPGKLSGGQQQRVALARALIMRPKVLLFDEPLSNLDAKLREEMRNEIRNLQQELSITTIYVTHDQDEAMSISDKVVVMNEGKIEQIGTPEEIYYYPENEFVADFIGRVNFLFGKVQKIYDEKIEVNLIEKLDLKINNNGVKDFSPKQKIKGIIRPEAVEFSENNYILEGKVTNKVFLGDCIEYYIDVGVEDIIQVNIYDPHLKKSYQIDEKVGLNFNEESLHLIEEE